MIKKVSNNHHHCRSFGKGYGELSHQKVLQNKKFNFFYKTLNLEPCDPTIHSKRSMSVECLFNGKTNGPILLKKLN